ncbi:MAG TPA: BlaI/MecI/CopY family transcriptional regulator [Rhodanobacteraceae bacterium]|jgi:predicted transcriptional regulator|nr:BlaI/MecI/CopY family transcriptional regulator [Rhodanobacteraceae bacterium]
MPRHVNPAISEAESQVMELLWKSAPQGSEELAAALQPATAWHENTVRTLLNRLIRKGAVRAERQGRRYLYSPVLTRERWQAHESRSLLDRVFGGKIAPLLVHFSRNEKLTAKDVAELRKLVDQLERKERHRG